MTPCAARTQPNRFKLLYGTVDTWVVPVSEKALGSSFALSLIHITVGSPVDNCKLVRINSFLMLTRTTESESSVSVAVRAFP